MKVEDLKERFKDHVLTEVLNTENTKVFEFRNKNGRTHHSQRWIIDRGTLIVMGDNYDAIYYWNDRHISLKFLADCNLGYFNEKCKADKDGQAQKVYCDASAEEYIKQIACDNIYQNFDEINELAGIDDGVWETLSLKEKFDAASIIIKRELDIDDYDLEGMFYFERVTDAYDFLVDSRNEFMFGEDGWEYGSDLEVLTATPKMHLTALRVAYEKYPEAF